MTDTGSTSRRIRVAIAASARYDGFEVLFERDGGEVSIAIRDSGGWQPPQDEPHPGHGLPLIRKLMDDVDIQPRPGGRRF